MYNYELFTIAVPTYNPELVKKFMEFMNEYAAGLWIGCIGIEIEKEEDIKIVLEKYVKNIHGMEESESV